MKTKNLKRKQTARPGGLLKPVGSAWCKHLVIGYPNGERRYCYKNIWGEKIAIPPSWCCCPICRQARPNDRGQR